MLLDDLEVVAARLNVGVAPLIVLPTWMPTLLAPVPVAAVNLDDRVRVGHVEVHEKLVVEVEGVNVSRDRIERDKLVELVFYSEFWCCFTFIHSEQAPRSNIFLALFLPQP